MQNVLLHGGDGMNSANVTRFRLHSKSGIAFAQQKSCWRSQQSATKSEDKARANFWQNSLHRHSLYAV